MRTPNWGTKPLKRALEIAAIASRTHFMKHTGLFPPDPLNIFRSQAAIEKRANGNGNSIVIPLATNPNRMAYVTLIALILLFFKTPAFGSNAKQSESPYFIEGFDVVSYFRESGPVTGDTEFMLIKNGLTLLFSNEQNMLDFQSTPEAYMPAYNGNCAYGMVYGMKSKVDPLQYDIVEGRLYLQLDGGTKNRWMRRMGKNITKADRIWKKLTSPREERR